VYSFVPAYISFRDQVPSGQTYKSPGEAYVEGDASSASYFLAGATMTGGTIVVEGCGSESLQGDVRFAEASAAFETASMLFYVNLGSSLWHPAGHGSDGCQARVVSLLDQNHRPQGLWAGAEGRWPRLQWHPWRSDDSSCCCLVRRRVSKPLTLFSHGLCFLTSFAWPPSLQDNDDPKRLQLARQGNRAHGGYCDGATETGGDCGGGPWLLCHHATQEGPKFPTAFGSSWRRSSCMQVTWCSSMTCPWWRLCPSQQVNSSVLIDTYDDHRMAMAFALTACGGVPVVINDPGCTRKTFPTYFSVLESVVKH